ncbi:MAG: PTS fructose transporter subunit IIA [Lachnospiraceae bacterium]|nr:PTS fructose transporter subunit IIA [Lachnospiraceae bacterium]
MKYILLVSHGTMAPGLHNALKMLAGEDHEDILSTSLENGMSSSTYAENVRKCISGITKEDEIILFGDLVGGSPLTTAANVISEENLLDRTVMIGGMSLPLTLSAVLMKDTMETKDLIEMLLTEAREEMKEFQIVNEENEDEI